MVKVIKTPDLGVDKAEIIELLVAPGDILAEGQSLLLAESDKASMEIPCPCSGLLISLKIKLGDSISEGVELCEIETETETETKQSLTSKESSTAEEIPTDQTRNQQSNFQQRSSAMQQVVVPDLGVDSAKIIEILAQVGERVEAEQGLVLLESDKASMELPAPCSGKLVELKVKLDDEIQQGMLVAVIETPEIIEKDKPSTAMATTDRSIDRSITDTSATTTPMVPPVSSIQTKSITSEQSNISNELVYAGPGVRKLARELAVDLALLTGSGSKGRILKEDIHQYVKNAVQTPATSPNVLNQESQTLDKNIDFSQYGEISLNSMSRLHQLTADAMVQSWLTVPRVSQFDQADITDLEAFRKETNALTENKENGTRLTLLAFLVCASVKALQKYPQFNVSVDGHQIIKKTYYNIGVAVDTPAGLMVPVIHHANNKSISEIATEIRELADKARKKSLKPLEMQGGCFSISSLGGIAGTGFTPIVNHPEVAIMGVANSSMQPIWNGNEFVPRLICPLSLSYDHRAVNGADAARFLGYIAKLVSDIRTLLL